MGFLCLEPLKTDMPADLAAAIWADRLAVRLGPAQAQEHVSAPRSDIRITFAGLSERAAADNRKC
jgi:hypothetical protein